MQDDAKRELLQMSERQLVDVSRTLDRYPDIDLKFIIGDQPSDKGAVPAVADRNIQLRIELERTLEGDMRPADAPRYAARHSESFRVEKPQFSWMKLLHLNVSTGLQSPFPAALA